MFHGFTSYCNEFWISFHTKCPHLRNVNGHEIRWRRVTVNGVNVEAIEPKILRDAIIAYDKKQVSLGIDDRLDNVRLYLQYCMLDEPFEVIESSVGDMRKRILDKLTSKMMKQDQFWKVVEDICADSDGDSGICDY